MSALGVAASGALITGGCSDETQNELIKPDDAMEALNLVLWAANVRTKSLDERLIAAQAGEFSAMTLFPIDVANFLHQGMTLSEIKQQCEDAGAPVVVLDPLTKWLPNWNPPDFMSEEDVAFTNFDEDTFFTMAEGLGVPSINLIETFGNDTPIEMATEHFARICDVAAERGLQVQLEFMPFSGIPDLATAWKIISDANRINGGLTFDTWHYCRGTMDNTLLASIPGEKIFRVQVADGAAEPVGDLFNDLMHYRRHAGDGAFPLTEIAQILQHKGGLNSVGPELFSDAMDALDADQAGRQAASKVRSFLNSALSTP